jgi:hypothetical protein
VVERKGQVRRAQSKGLVVTGSTVWCGTVWCGTVWRSTVWCSTCHIRPQRLGELAFDARIIRHSCCTAHCSPRITCEYGVRVWCASMVCAEKKRSMSTVHMSTVNKVPNSATTHLYSLLPPTCTLYYHPPALSPTTHLHSLLPPTCALYYHPPALSTTTHLHSLLPPTFTLHWPYHPVDLVGHCSEVLRR